MVNRKNSSNEFLSHLTFRNVKKHKELVYVVCRGDWKISFSFIKNKQREIF